MLVFKDIANLSTFETVALGAVECLGLDAFGLIPCWLSNHVLIV